MEDDEFKKTQIELAGLHALLGLTSDPVRWLELQYEVDRLESRLWEIALGKSAE